MDVVFDLPVALIDYRLSTGAGSVISGTADDSSPYPQLRELRLSHASTRAALAVTCGPLRRRGRRRKGEGRSGAEAAGQGPAALPAPVHQRPDVDHGPEFSGSSP